MTFKKFKKKNVLVSYRRADVCGRLTCTALKRFFRTKTIGHLSSRTKITEKKRREIIFLDRKK